MPKVLSFSNTAWYLYNYRVPIDRILRERGWDVVMASPDGEFRTRVEDAGFRWCEVPMTRSGLNPIDEWRTVRALMHLIRSEKPDVLHTFTMKGNINGSIAARSVGLTSVVNSIAGMGFVFSSDQWLAWLLRNPARLAYRAALSRGEVIFQNGEDLRTFVDEGITANHRTTLVRSSGVDTAVFAPERRNNEVVKIIFAARLLWTKGIGELIEAAKLLRGRGVEFELLVAGMPDHGNPESIPMRALNAWEAEGLVTKLEFQDDMATLLKKCDVACFPSKHREGTSRFLIEAASCGLPIVTTRNRGCEEVVKHEVNGLLVEMGEVNGLADALQRLIGNARLRREYGLRSRAIAERDFAVANVAHRTEMVYERALAGRDFAKPTADPSRASRLKIVQLGKYYPPHLGGIENNVRHCCLALSEDYAVTALVFNEAPTTVRERDGEIDVIRLRTFGQISSQELCLTLGFELLKLRPDIVHLHAPNPLAMTFFWLLMPKTPIVITHHTDMVRQKFLRQVFRPVYQHLLKRSAAVVVYTKQYAENCEELKDYPGEPVIIPHGTESPDFLEDPAFLAEASEYRREVTGGHAMAVFVGRLVAYKALPVLIEAASNLKNLRVFIAGSGPEEASLREMVKELGIEDRIVFAGSIRGREKWRLIAAGDFLVLPSLNLTESFGQVLVEAQLCGKPTVTTDIPGGVNEVTVEGVTGLRVPAGDVDELTAAMKRLASDPALRQEMGGAGKARARENFVVSVTEEKLRRLFKTVSKNVR